MMTKTQAFDYLQTLGTYGSRPGLCSITELCRRLKNPQDALSFVHIAGTNGKGSVAAYVSQIAKTAGIKVGRYVSPTISDYRERFTVNNRMISYKDLQVYLERLKTVCDEMVSDGLAHPTAFEVETALGFLYFLEKGCELVVLECGMGGALDATNVICTTKVAVVTNIGLDHMAFLGKTLEEIAVQKAGIVKPGCKLVLYPNEQSVTDVIIEKAREYGVSADDTTVINEQDVHAVRCKLNKQTFDYKNRKKLNITLNGIHQCLNAAVAIEVIEQLNNSGYQINDKAIADGLIAVSWPARLEQIDKKPVFMIDGAHNPQGAGMLRNAIDTYFAGKDFTYIIGVFADKDYEQILSIMCDRAKRIITVKTPDNARALDAVRLAESAHVYCDNVTAASSVEEAVEMAYLLTPKDEIILAFGSLSYLGRLKDAVEKRKA